MATYLIISLSLEIKRIPSDYLTNMKFKKISLIHFSNVLFKICYWYLASRKHVNK